MIYNCKESNFEELRLMNAENIIQGVTLVAENPWIIAVFVAALLIVFFLILKTSLKLAAKVLINAIIGFVLLFVSNGIGSMFGIALEITWLNAIIAGVLGDFLPYRAVIIILGVIALFAVWVFIVIPSDENRKVYEAQRTNE